MSDNNGAEIGVWFAAGALWRMRQQQEATNAALDAMLTPAQRAHRDALLAQQRQPGPGERFTMGVLDLVGIVFLLGVALFVLAVIAFWLGAELRFDWACANGYYDVHGDCKAFD